MIDKNELTIERRSGEDRRDGYPYCLCHAKHASKLSDHSERHDKTETIMDKLFNKFDSYTKLKTFWSIVTLAALCIAGIAAMTQLGYWRLHEISERNSKSLVELKTMQQTILEDVREIKRNGHYQRQGEEK